MPLFTRETASEFGRRGNLARWSRPHSPESLPAIIPPIADGFAESLSLQLRKRVTKLLSLLDQAIADNDKKGCALLSNAIDKLQYHEHYLSGRPAPGSLKPVKPKQPIMHNLNEHEIQLLPVSTSQDQQSSAG